MVLVTSLGWRTRAGLGKSAGLLGKLQGWEGGPGAPERRSPACLSRGQSSQLSVALSPPPSTHQPTLEPESQKQGTERQDGVKTSMPTAHLPLSLTPSTLPPCATLFRRPRGASEATPLPRPFQPGPHRCPLMLGREPHLECQPLRASLPGTWALSCSAFPPSSSLS